MDKDEQILELQKSCKRFREEAIALRTAPAVLAHALRRAMQQIGTGSKLYRECLLALDYAAPQKGVDHEC
jgi:hypothetical protein